MLFYDIDQHITFTILFSILIILVSSAHTHSTSRYNIIHRRFPERSCTVPPSGRTKQPYWHTEMTQYDMSHLFQGFMVRLCAASNNFPPESSGGVYSDLYCHRRKIKAHWKCPGKKQLQKAATDLRQCRKWVSSYWTKGSWIIHATNARYEGDSEDGRLLLPHVLYLPAGRRGHWVQGVPVWTGDPRSTSTFVFCHVAWQR